MACAASTGRWVAESGRCPAAEKGRWTVAMVAPRGGLVVGDSVSVWTEVGIVDVIVVTVVPTPPSAAALLLRDMASCGCAVCACCAGAGACVEGGRLEER